MTREIPDSIRAAANQICELLERRTRVSYDEIRDELMSVECLVEDLIAARELAAIREGSELTAEQREWIERYTDFKTDSSPITKAMRAALSDRDRYAVENARLKEQLADKERQCGELHKLRNRVIEIFQPMQDKGQSGHTFEMLLKRARDIAPAAAEGGPQ